MPRFKLSIEYAGTRYSGWQIQKNARTVQGELDRAIREATQRNVFEFYGSGRTDAGVHALGQVAHLDPYTALDPERLRQRINDALPADIHVLAIAKAPHRFHARHEPPRAATCIRSPGGAPLSPSHSCGGFASRSISPRCAISPARSSG